MLHLVDDDDDAFSETDMAALEQAMVLIRTESPGRAEQIDSMLEHRDWEDVPPASYSLVRSD